MSAVAIIIKNEGKYLLSKRSKDKAEEPSKWENVGGSVIEGETFEDAIRREVKEEIGVEIENLKIALEYKKDNGVVVTTVFAGTINGNPTIMEPEECDELAWFSVEELQTLDLANYTKGDFVKLEVFQH